jgi:hypothetical protein
VCESIYNERRRHILLASGRVSTEQTEGDSEGETCSTQLDCKRDSVGGKSAYICYIIADRFANR